MESKAMTLAAADDGISETTCRVCGSHDVYFICRTPNGHSATESILNFRCFGCGAVFVGNDLSDEELGIAYSSLDYGAYYEEIVLENGNKMRTAVANLFNFANPNDRIIDIGTGNGEFLKTLHDAGFEKVSGHELPGADLTNVKTAVRSIFQDYDYRSVPTEQFDVATLLDVVEHVRDPQYLMDQCFRVLKPGGHIYFHTPVVTRTDRLMHSLSRLPISAKFANVWLRGRTSIFHLQNYSERSLRLLLERSGFVLKSLEIRNELSWPVRMYVRVYVVDRFKLPRFTGQLLTPAVYPLISTDFFNANKAIVLAQKP